MTSLVRLQITNRSDGRDYQCLSNDEAGEKADSRDEVRSRPSVGPSLLHQVMPDLQVGSDGGLVLV